MLGGLGVLLVITPINVYLVRKCRAAAKMGMDEKDKRMKLVNEILNGIQVLYAEEKLGRAKRKRVFGHMRAAKA